MKPSERIVQLLHYKPEHCNAQELFYAILKYLDEQQAKKETP